MEVGAPQPNAVRCVEQIDRADTHALILSVRGFSQATLRNISNPRNPDGSRFAKHRYLEAKILHPSAIMLID